MSLKSDRQRVALASENLIARRKALHRKTDWLLEGFERWKPTLIVGGGLIAGFLIGRGTLSNATRSAISIASVSMALMRSSLGSMLLAKTFQSSPRPAAPVVDSGAGQR